MRIFIYAVSCSWKLKTSREYSKPIIKNGTKYETLLLLEKPKPRSEYEVRNLAYNVVRDRESVVNGYTKEYT